MRSTFQVVDSSGWIEVLTNGSQSERCLEALQDENSLIVPSITILEVFKWTLREHSEAQAIQAITCALRLPMADSIILKTARQNKARLYSMDADCKGLEAVELILKLS